MSFSVSTSGPKEQVVETVKGSLYVPQSIKDYIVAGVEALKTEKVKVYAYGHLYNGGDYSTTTANVTVSPLVEE